MQTTAMTAQKHRTYEDAGLGVIRVEVGGRLDTQSLESHFKQLAFIAAQWRAQGRPLRTLVHALDLEPHTPEAQRYVEGANRSIYGPGDKIAVLLPSCVSKKQMRSAFEDKSVIEFFISEKAALLWLGVAD